MPPLVQPEYDEDGNPVYESATEQYAPVPPAVAGAVPLGGGGTPSQPAPQVYGPPQQPTAEYQAPASTETYQAQPVPQNPPPETARTPYATNPIDAAGPTQGPWTPPDPEYTEWLEGAPPYTYRTGWPADVLKIPGALKATGGLTKAGLPLTIYPDEYWESTGMYPRLKHGIA